MHGIPVQTGLMGLFPSLHIADGSPPISGCCWLPTLTVFQAYHLQTGGRQPPWGHRAKMDKMSMGTKRRERGWWWVTPCGDKLSNPPAIVECRQDTSHLFVFQGGPPKLSLTSSKPQCVTKQSWKYQLCSI